MLYLGLAIFWHNLKVPTRRGFALAAVFLGIAMLIRSIAIAILPVCVLIVWFTQHPAHKKAISSAVLLGVGALVVLPWSVLIHTQTEQFVLLGTNSVPSVRDGLTFAVGKAYRQEFQLSEPVLALMERLLERRAEMNSLGEILAVLRQEAERDPAAVLNLLALKAARSWYATDSGRLEVVSALLQLGYVLLVGIGTGLALHRLPQARIYVLGTW